MTWPKMVFDRGAAALAKKGKLFHLLETIIYSASLNYSIKKTVQLFTVRCSLGEKLTKCDKLAEEYDPKRTNEQLNSFQK